MPGCWHLLQERWPFKNHPMFRDIYGYGSKHIVPKFIKILGPLLSHFFTHHISRTKKGPRWPWFCQEWYFKSSSISHEKTTWKEHEAGHLKLISDTPVASHEWPFLFSIHCWAPRHIWVYPSFWVPMQHPPARSNVAGHGWRAIKRCIDGNWTAWLA